jgi:cytochrome P450
MRWRHVSLGQGVRSGGLDGWNPLVPLAGSAVLLRRHETTANMLGLGTLALLRHPEQLAAVRDDPAAVEPAVEELLRWLSIVPQGILRTTTTEVTLAGQTMPAGELVAVSLLAANRDPALVEDPDRLDITRGAMGHVAFGHGLHHCLGAPLARMEMRTAFPALLRRFPKLDLAVPFEEVPFRPHHFIHGLQSLPVTW